MKCLPWTDIYAYSQASIAMDILNKSAQFVCICCISGFGTIGMHLVVKCCGRLLYYCLELEITIAPLGSFLKASLGRMGTPFETD